MALTLDTPIVEFHRHGRCAAQFAEHATYQVEQTFGVGLATRR